MYKILKKQGLAPQITKMVVQAPAIAKKAEPGQFIILRIDERGERIPLTIADFDRQAGTVTVIFQTVGKTTQQLSELSEGQGILDFVGPLGTASEFEPLPKRAAVIGGGLGSAIAYPQAKRLTELGVEVDVIAGFRNTDFIILEEELKACSKNLYITTDDGSNGRKGLVTDVLKERIEAGANYDLVVAIGPLIMMKFVSLLTKQYGIKTIVSMNTIMIDGTGMCGGCRLTVGGETKFACVDGPDFDGHLVDFDEAMRRQGVYKDMEQQSRELHCRLEGMGTK